MYFYVNIFPVNLCRKQILNPPLFVVTQRVQYLEKEPFFFSLGEESGGRICSGTFISADGSALEQ